ncbi:DUF2913 family protein [Salmonella enterica]|nr:DUF2913 family protein [Salmonella enterica]EAP4147602.1 DUF2913 family protein [Salmonella enterica subsp. enterica serovar Anatum]ECI0430455.1 DUF2913 family protein [Salmonella enterica subsp. enterica serovar Soumbedioune]ECS5236987.1 DUF2913 family protein [Salmonella enterica subsp. enterica serovar Sundsvall]ECT9500449.1 DUF2913 family protein [Salmonella enterica subsp. enterica serovar Infantis]EDV6184443.1 DUF2913 family protein [Salmonella enterica subsp. enterica serovar Pomona]
MTLTEKSGHLAWCALVALALAKQNGDVLSPAQENLFLTRWLAAALKQRRFSRDVTPDLKWLLKQGGQLGVGAKLAGKLDYLWRSCSGELAEQNDLFRLTYALETVKDMSWTYRLLNDREWSGRYAVALNGAVNGVYLSRSNLDVAFDDNGYQVNPLMAQLTGNVGGVMKLLNRCGWHSADRLYQFIKTEVVGEMFAGPANDRLMEKLSDGFIHTYVLMWVYVFQRR